MKTIVAILLAFVVHERWSIKTSIPPKADMEHPIAVPLSYLKKLPNAPGVVHNDKRFVMARIPDEIHAGEKGDFYKLQEGDIVMTSGWLTLAAKEDDGDYHLQLAEEPFGDNAVFIVESPDPQYLHQRVLKRLVDHWRTELKQSGFHISPKKAEKPMMVICVGPLFYDDSHVGTSPRGKDGQKATTLWELHPAWCMKVDE